MKNSGIAWIGEIPKEWEVIRQKNIFSLGKELVGEEWKSTQLLSLTTQGIRCVSIGSTSGKVPDSYSTYQKVQPNNLVMCLFDLDCSAVFSGLSKVNGMISPAYKVLSISENAHPDFYRYWFDYIFDGRKFMFLSKNIRYSLTYDEFASLGIVQPSLQEQQLIANFLEEKCGEIDELVALQEKMIDELKAYKQSVITETVTKGLDSNVKMKDSGVDWIGEIPEHWKTIKLGQIFSFLGGYAFDSSKFTDETKNQVIRIGNVKNDKLVLTKNPVFVDSETAFVAKDFKLVKDSIVFSMTGTRGKRDYFFTLLVKDEDLKDKQLYINQRVGCMISKSDVIPNYYNYLLKSSLILDNIFLYETGTVNQGNLGIGSISNTIVQYPPTDEQQSIATYLDEKCSEIDSLISIKQKKIEALKDYKKSLIYEYVTGKKQVV